MTREHKAPKGRSHRTPLYDPDIPTPSHAERARTLLATVGTGTLCTAHGEHDGHPYGSFVTYGMHGDTPVFLISALAEHTRNLLRDDRASLMVVEPGQGDPLARARATLVGRCKQTQGDLRDQCREAFLEAHPGASYYADFKDFSLWTLAVQSVRYIGGYGRMSWLDDGMWNGAEPDPIAPFADRIIGHMNEDHAEALTLCCQAYSRAKEFDGVRMTGIDQYGFEMSVGTAHGPRVVRVAFKSPIGTASDARTELVALTKAARAQAEASSSV